MSAWKLPLIVAAIRDPDSGLHTGECELLPDDDVGGLAVHIGAAGQQPRQTRRGARQQHRPRPRRRFGSDAYRPRSTRAQGRSGSWRVFAVET
jgi:hypothetical protein